MFTGPQQAKQGVLDQAGYTGFEKDVFKEVLKYFNDNEAPLIPNTYAKAFSHAFMYLEFSENLQAEVNFSKEDNQTEILPSSTYPMSSKSIENLVLGMSSPIRSSMNPFIQQNIAQYHNWQVEHTNPFAEYVTTPVPLAFFEKVSSCESSPLHNDSQSMHQSCDSNQIVSGSKILTTVLPPNSCFETAFTSESPTTRIIPQCTVDTLHFQRRQRAKQSQRVLAFSSPESPEYVRMDMYRKQKKAFSKRHVKNEPKLMKRNMSNGSLYSFQSSQSYELSSQSEISGKLSSGGVVSAGCRSYEAHKHKSGELVTRAKISSEFQSGVCAPGDMYLAMETRNKPQCFNDTVIERPALPPKPVASAIQKHVIYENLQDLKNQSGGYVNLALSYDDANYNEKLDSKLVQELDVNFAMASLFSLMKCSQDADPVAAHSTPAHRDASPLPPRLSLSSIGSCQISATENTPTPQHTTQDIASAGYVRRRSIPELKLPEEFPG